MAAGVLDRQAPRPADVQDGPAVAVLDPVGGAEAQPAVVGAGDDQVPDLGVFPSARRTSACRLACRSRRWVWARWLSWATSSRVGASMIASRPAARSGPRR